MNVLKHGEICYKISVEETPDGVGGTTTETQKGEPFIALIDLDNSTKTRIAEQSGFESVYTVTVDANESIAFDDIFIRDFDKACFKVTSNPDDQVLPKKARMAPFKVFAAKAYKIAGEV